MNERFEVLGLIPARGGSKSIPYKNIAMLAGRPLLEYVAEAARASGSIRRLLCSTDDDRIAATCQGLSVSVDRRPAELAGDDSPVVATMIELVQRLQSDEGYCPDAIALLQPTSPFTLPAHIDACVQALRDHPEAGSSQTVASMPHNFHAFNQREIIDGVVDFRFPEERATCYNKQIKPKFYSFGNLVVVRTSALLEQRAVFARPSRAVTIQAAYALDVDGPDDFPLAEWYLQQRRVELPWVATKGGA